MRKRRSWWVIVVLFALVCACQAQQGAPWVISGPNAQSEYQSIGETNIFSHGVIVSNETAVVSTDQSAEADEVTGVVVAEGDVTIVDHGHIWRGTNFVYNFKTGEVRANTFKTVQTPFTMTGQNLAGSSNSFYMATNAFISTDDFSSPGYRIRARHINIVVGKYFEAYQATLFFGKVPVFYFPYLRKTLGQHPNNFEFVPGYRSIFGPYLLSAYNWYGNGFLDGTVHFDLRESRGIATGPDLFMHLGNAGEAAFRYYYANDQNPNADGLNAPHLGENRQRLSFYYDVHPTSNFTAKVVANYQSDPLIVRDFYESEYIANVEPNSFAEGSQLWPNYTLDMVVQPQLVTFFETVERLPDVKLSGARQQVGETPLFYESESSIGYFKRAFSNTNSPYYTTNFMLAPDGLDFLETRNYHANPADYAATRADTFHQFTLPETFFGWLNVAPRAGGRFTYYSDVDGPQTHTNEQVRGVFNTGVDVSFKASRIYRDAESELFDVNELRHIIEPDFDYVYVPAPTRGASHLPQFDYQQPSLRLLPIDFPDFNSIDSIDRMNVLRLSLRNILQTKRKDGIEDLVNWAVYTDWNLRPGTNTTFSDLYSDLDFRPRTWLTLSSSTRYDLANDRFREAIERVVVQPSTKWSFALTYDYLINNDPEFQDYFGETVPGHNLVSASFYYRMNENWGARIAERYEAQNGAFQEQLYSIYRDLRSWTAALTFRVLQGAGQPTDFTAAITFSLKAFPRFGLNSDSDHASSLLGSAPNSDVLDRY
jgi:LPS-assembly protein